MKNPIYILLLISLCCFVILKECYGQKSKVQNLPKYDHQWIHFGFTLGINNADFIIHPSPDIKKLDSVYVVESQAQKGFNLGIVSNLRLGYYFDLRFIPALSFSQRKLEYTLTGKNLKPVLIIKNVESTFLEFPLSVKYKSVRVNNGRAYVMGGAKFSIDLASQEDVEEDIVKLKKYDYSYEIGFGLDFYLQYFKFSPEIKLSFGINDMLVKDETIFSQSIDKLNSKILFLSFTFE